MDRLEALLDYLSKLDSVREKLAGGIIMKTVEEKILKVCDEIEKELKIPQFKTNVAEDIKLNVNLDGIKIFDAVIQELNRKELIGLNAKKL